MQQEKRIKERYVYEAIDKVNQWRNYFEMGVYRPNGTFYKPTLQEAADMVEIPKKTLEDYRLVLKQVSGIVNLEDNYIRNQKMGFLRKLVKERSSKTKNRNQKQNGSQELEQIQTQNSSERYPEAIPQEEQRYYYDSEINYQPNYEDKQYQDMIIEGDFVQDQFLEEIEEQQQYSQLPLNFQGYSQDQRFWPTLIISDSENAIREIQNSQKNEIDPQDIYFKRNSIRGMREHWKTESFDEYFVADQNLAPLCTF